MCAAKLRFINGNILDFAARAPAFRKSRALAACKTLASKLRFVDAFLVALDARVPLASTHLDAYFDVGSRSAGVDQ